MKAKLIIEGQEVEIEISKEELNKLRKQNVNNGYERVSEQKNYYFINANNNIVSCPDDYVHDDIVRYNNANYYSSESIAENNARTDNLIRKLRRFAVEHRNKAINWDNSPMNKYCICYSHTENKLFVNAVNVIQGFSQIYFDTFKNASIAMHEFENELIWYFTEYKDSL